ncbi:MAG: GumC family protein [Saprospiraceae bacterium]
MELQYFLNILWRRKWLILAAMLIAALTAFFIVGQQAYTYKAQATISTGIIGEQGLDLNAENPYIQEYQIKMHFGNLITSLLSRKNMDFLTYHLIRHDTDPAAVNAEKPFRNMEKRDVSEDIETEYSASTIQQMNDLLEEKIDSFDYTFEKSPEMQNVFTNLSKAFGYDRESMLRFNLETNRSGESDNILVSFVSENPELSAWAVNQFCESSIAFNKHKKELVEERRLEFADDERAKKKKELDTKTQTLKRYKQEKNVVDVKTSSEALVGRRKQLMIDKEQLSNQTIAISSNIRRLEGDIATLRKDKIFLEGERESTNTALDNTSKKIKQLEVQLAEKDYKDEGIKKQLEFLKINQKKLMEKYAEDQIKSGKILETQNTLENLFRKKTDLQNELAVVEQRQASIKSELGRISNDNLKYVDVDANIQALEKDIEILTKDYESLLRQYENKKRSYASTFFPLRILEYAQNPDKAQPRYRAVITAFSGIVGAVLATIAILFASFFDTSLNSPAKFEKYAEVPLVSTVNKIKTKNLNLQELFSSNGNVKSRDVFKESIRNLRFAMEDSGARKFLFTSTKREEGKTFLMLNLAHTLKLKGKKVLLVDTNFKNNSLTQMSHDTRQANAMASRLVGESNLDEDFLTTSTNTAFHLEDVDILGNKGSNLSPSEVFAGKDFDHMIDRLADEYDYIFLEGAAMNDYSDSKELIDFVDKVVVVFSADSEIRQADKTDLTFLRGLGNKFMGAILNKVDLKDLK